MAQAQWKVGVQAGYGQAWNFYDRELPEGAEIDVPGYHLSAQAYYAITPWLSVGVEPGFVRRGAACIPDWGPIFVGDTQWHLNYVSAPLMVQGSWPNIAGTGLRVFGSLGAGVSYRVGGFTRSVDLETGEVNGEIKFKDLFFPTPPTLWDAGAHTNLGLGIPVFGQELTVRAEYYHGLMDTSIDTTSKNRSLSVAIGYTFAL